MALRHCPCSTPKHVCFSRRVQVMADERQLPLFKELEAMPGVQYLAGETLFVC